MSSLKALPSLLFVLLGAFLLSSAFTAPVRMLSPGDPGPWLLPTVVGVLMMLFGAIETFRQLRTPALSNPVEPSEAGASEGLIYPLWVQAALGATLVGYVLAFSLIGYTLSSIAFIAIATYLMSDRRPIKIVVALGVSIVSVFAVQLFLTEVVGVILPTGF